MKILLKELTEGVRAIAGLPVAGSPGGLPVSERNRFDRVIANLAEIEACELVEKYGCESDCSEEQAEVSWHLTPQGDYIGIFRLPQKCLRVMGIKLPDRSEILTEIIYPEDSTHWQRYSSFPEISGDPDNPRLYLVTGRGHREIEIHRCRNDHAGTSVICLHRPEWKDAEMEIPDAAAPQLILRTGMRLRDLLK